MVWMWFLSCQIEAYYSWAGHDFIGLSVSVCVRVSLCRRGQGAQLRVMSVWDLFYLQAPFSWSQPAVLNARMQKADGSFCLFPSLMFSSIPPTRFTSISYNIPLSVCVYACAEFISRSNWDDISALQIKLFSSSVHLFSCSFVPRPPTDSLSLRAKNLHS